MPGHPELAATIPKNAIPYAAALAPPCAPVNSFARPPLTRRLESVTFCPSLRKHAAGKTTEPRGNVIGAESIPFMRNRPIPGASRGRSRSTETTPARPSAILGTPPCIERLL